MPEETDLIVDRGVQDDGEPTAVVETPTEKVETAEVPAETQEATQETTEEKPHKKPGSQRAKERLARVEAENEQLRQMLLGRQEPPKPAPVVPSGKPKAEDFESHEDWVEAVADWKAKDILRQREAEEAQRRQKQTLDSLVAKGREKYEDFDMDFQEILRAPVLSPTVAEALQESEVAPDLVHHFAENPDDLHKISLMSPLKAAREIAKLEASFAPQTRTSTPPPPTKAPKPPTPVPAAVAVRPGEDGYFTY
jgi:hypothetical protein